jgi:hypothetical protein
MRKPKYETNSKSEFSKAQNGHFAGFEHLNFGNSDLFGISILNSKKPRGLSQRDDFVKAHPTKR